MRRLLIPVLLTLVAVLGGAGVGGARAAAKSHPPFTLKGATLSVESGRLTYSVTICTPGKSVLHVVGSFRPESKRARAQTITPGATQYQSPGCWPAFVSAPVAVSEERGCALLSCPAVKGVRYEASFRITDEHPRWSEQAPRELADA